MSLKNIIRRAEIAALEIAAGDLQWWNSLSKPQQKAYVKKHPNSKYAKKFGSGLGVTTTKPASTTTPKDGPKIRGAKALKQAAKSAKVEKPVPTTKTENKETKPKTKLKEQPSRGIWKKKSKDTPKKKTGDSKSRGRPSSISPKEKIKHKEQRIKSLQERIKVLEAEKNYRNAARAYTKRETTKERLKERLMKINEMVKGINSKIKSYEKAVAELKKSLIK